MSIYFDKPNPTIYISGKMSGVEDWNFPAFFELDEKLSADGYKVINPAKNDGETLEEALASVGTFDNPAHDWAEYIKKDVKQLMDANAICVLPGWQNSRGATLEVKLGQALGLPICIYGEKNKVKQLLPRVELIGLSGYARTGKDTAAEILSNYGYQRASFADAIRDALYRLNPEVEVTGAYQREEDGVRLGTHFSLQSLVDNYGWENTKAEPDVRRLLQVFGTEIGREMFGENFWVDYLLNNLPDGSKVVITDCRYPNEADAVKAMGGKMWRIKRPDVTAVNGHISERALDDYEDFDFVINNSKDIEAFSKVLGELVRLRA